MLSLRKIGNTLRDSFYQNKVDKIVFYQKIFGLQEDCTNLNMFTEVSSLEPSELSPDEIHCFREENLEIGSVVMRNTYYIFFNNSCLIYSKTGHNRIIRIKIKRVEDKWNIGNTDGHLQILNESNEIYAWWDVDWMGLGKKDNNMCFKSGSWWKHVYDDVCKIYENVEMKGADYLFDKNYKDYRKQGGDI